MPPFLLAGAAAAIVVGGIIVFRTVGKLTAPWFGLKRYHGPPEEPSPTGPSYPGDRTEQP